MLERIRNRIRGRMATTDKFSEAETALNNVPLFWSGSFDINIALNGFIGTLKSKIEEDPENLGKSRIDTKIIKQLDTYVAEIERGYKFFFTVRDIDYSFSDSDYDDSPPPAKIARLKDLKETEPPNDNHELEAALEQYFNRLKIKITKFLFYTDNEGRAYCSSDQHRMVILREFIIRSGLSQSEVQEFIKAPLLPNMQPDTE